MNKTSIKHPKRLIAMCACAAVALAAVLAVSFAMNGGSRMTMDTVVREPHFAGTVTALYDTSLLVSVNEDEEARQSSDLIEVPFDTELGGSMSGFLIGDEIIVYYDGVIAESHPARISRVYAIVLTNPDRRLNADDLKALSLLRTPAVGNNSAVGKIVDALPPLDAELTQRFFSIGDDYGTGHAPYTLTLYYERNGAERNISASPKNAALLFALIDNLEEVSFACRNTPDGGALDKAAYTSRAAVNREQSGEFLRSAGLTWEDFQRDFEAAAGALFAQAEYVGTLSPRVEDLPLDYSKDEAIAAGVYVNIHGSEIYNQKSVDLFYENVFAEEPAVLRTMNYTVEGDPIITDYRFDGESFTVVTDTRRDGFGSPMIFSATYKYLVPHDRAFPKGTSMEYFLSDEQNIYANTRDDDATLIDNLGSIPSPSGSVTAP
jgi:hypothetical protein